MITVLIVEDDPAMCHVLRKTLEKIPEVEVLGEAGNGITALKMVEELNPRVVFIDIELPGKNGVELAREICELDPQTILIFVTAYNDYTHEAFEVYAFDYLVKPFRLDRINKTMERIKQQEHHKVSSVKHNQFPVRLTPSKLVVKQNERLIFLDTREIIFITRENRKTVIYTAKCQLNITENLNNLEERLTAKSFFRSHRGYIVNLSKIKEIYPWGKRGYQIAFNGTELTALLSWDKAKELAKILVMPGH